jgi:hypothetical protein
MNRDELIELRKQIESEYKADIAAVTQLMKRYPEKEDKTLPLNGTNGEGDKSTSELVAGYANAMPGNFSLIDIIDLVTAATGEAPNRQTVSGALFRLKEDGKLRVVQSAQGRRPAIYTKI